MKFTKRWTRRILQTSLSHCTDIIRWELLFLETGDIGQKGGNEKRRTSGTIIQQIKELLPNDFTFSICAASSRIEAPNTAVSHPLHKCLLLFTYKLGRFQPLTRSDNGSPPELPEHYCQKVKCYSEYWSKLDFPSAWLICINSVVNKRNVNVWSLEHPNDDILLVF